MIAATITYVGPNDFNGLPVEIIKAHSSYVHRGDRVYTVQTVSAVPFKGHGTHRYMFAAYGRELLVSLVCEDCSGTGAVPSIGGLVERSQSVQATGDTFTLEIFDDNGLAPCPSCAR